MVQASYNGRLASGGADAALDLLMMKSAMKDTVHYIVVTEVLTDANYPDLEKTRLSDTVSSLLAMGLHEAYWCYSGQFRTRP